MPLSVVTASAETDGYYTYSVSNGKATITDVDESISGAVTIPSTLGGYPVTSIGYYAFLNCTSITSVTIPDSVTSIGEDAFYECSSLTKVNITDIAAWCNIDFGDSTANPLYYAEKLYLNDGLVTNLVIPDTVTSIGDSAFYWCDSLTSVTIPDSVTSIGNYAFAYCDFFTSVTIPDSVTSIGDSAFYNCDYLITVYYRGSENDRKNITIGSYNEDLTNATWYYNSCIGSAEHNIVNGKCTVCEPIEIILGDCNADGAVDTTDLAVIKLYLAGINNNIGIGADFNGDGKVDTTDLASLKLKLAGIE